jgi:hypothetical protein
MNRLPNQQKGASAIAVFIFLALLAYAVYIGIQYVPQVIEAKSIDSILTNLKAENKMDRITDEQQVKSKVTKLLQINEMNDMTKSFTVRRVSDTLTVTFSYDRELNLGFKKHPMHYEKSLVLK